MSKEKDLDSLSSPWLPICGSGFSVLFLQLLLQTKPKKCCGTKECTYGSLEGALEKETKQKSSAWTSVSPADSVSHQENYRHKFCSPHHHLCRLLQVWFQAFWCFPSIIFSYYNTSSFLFKSCYKETNLSIYF